MLSDARIAEVDAVISRLVEFAAAHSEVRGLVLVGSWARGAARMDSDVDVVVLAAEPTALTPDTWTDLFRGGDVVRRQRWGPVDEMRIGLASGLEVEVGVAPLSWAATGPVDAGTGRVMNDGHRILYDPDSRLSQLADACRGS